MEQPPPSLSLTNSHEALKILQQKLTCPKCMDIYNDPKILSCFHSFCWECLRCLQVNEENQICCPLCQLCFTLPAGGIAGLPASFFMNNLKEIYKLLKTAIGDETELCKSCEKSSISCYCRECDSFSCESCYDLHQKWRPNADHHVLSLDEVASNAYEYGKKEVTMKCATHDKSLDIYCEKCQELVCYLCTIGMHRKHKCNVVSDCIGEHRLLIEGSIQKLQEKKDILTAAAGEVQQRRNEIELQGKRVEEEIHDEFLKIEKQVLDSLSGAMEQKLRNLDEQVEDIKRASDHLTECIETIQESLKVGTPQQLLMTKSIIMDNASNAATEMRKKDLVPVEKADIRVAKDWNFEDSKKKLMHVFYSTKQRKFSINFLRSPSPILGKECKWILSLKFSDGSFACLPPSALICTLESMDGDAYTVSTQQATCIVKAAGKKGNYEITCVPVMRGSQKLRTQCILISGRPEDVNGSPFDIYVSEIPSAGDKPDVLTHFLRDPWGVCVSDEHKMIAVSENYGDHSVYVYSQNFGHINHIGSIRSEGEDYAYRPRGVAFTRKGTIVVVEYALDRVKEVSVEGEVIRSVQRRGRGKLEFDRPTAVAIDTRTENIFIADVNRIQVLNKNFTFSHFIETTGDDLLFDSDGYLYVLCHNSVSKFTTEGRKIEEFNLATPPEGIEIYWKGMAIDKNELLYITEQKHTTDYKYFGSCISVYTKHGEFIQSFAQDLDGFHCPIGIAIDKRGSLYVCYHGSDQVVKY